MENDTLNFLATWNTWGQIASIIAASLGILVALYYFVKLVTIKDYKKKYDFINLNEINLLWISSLFLIIAGSIYVNTLVAKPDLVWFIVRIFVSVMFALIVGVAVSNVLRVYYPSYIEKRLHRLRFTPRVSPNTGKPMKLLSEEEEDVHLDEGMQAEENIFSIDYDVWIDEETGYTQIDKYAGHLHALACPECSYQTLKVAKEEIITSPTVETSGELLKFYKCGYCNHKERKVFRVAKLIETREVAPQMQGATV